MPSSLDVSPLSSRPGQPAKKSFQQMQGCKNMSFVCRWLLMHSSKNIHKRMRNFIGFEKQKCCSWHVAGNHGYLKENHVEWLGFFKLYGRFELKTDILLYQHGRPKKCKMAANRLKPREYVILVKIAACTKKTWRLRQTRELKRKGGGSRMVRYPPLYNSADPPRHWFSRSKTGGRKPPPQDASI